MNGATVRIDLARIRTNAQAIIADTKVPLIAVVKADAYGLGAREVGRVLGELVHSFYVFNAGEAVVAGLWDSTGKPAIALTSAWNQSDDFLSHHVHPVVWTLDQASAFRKARPILSIDTGQQRFCCLETQAHAVREAGDCREVMTHAVTLTQAQRFGEIVKSWPDRLFTHAAASSLLHERSAFLDAVRPGLALYQGAVHVAATLVEVKDSNGPAGYTGFIERRFGVILAGYSQGMRQGPCMINGRVQRVIEVGMQTCFVSADAGDRVGDEVILLDDHPAVNQAAVASAWGSSQQEVLVRLTKIGQRGYLCS